MFIEFNQLLGLPENFREVLNYAQSIAASQKVASRRLNQNSGNFTDIVIMPILDVELKTDYNNRGRNMKFDWNVTEVTNKTITLQLDFDRPESISVGDVPDILQIDVLIKLFFVSNDYSKILVTESL